MLTWHQLLDQPERVEAKILRNKIIERRFNNSVEKYQDYSAKACAEAKRWNEVLQNTDDNSSVNLKPI